MLLLVGLILNVAACNCYVPPINAPITTTFFTEYPPYGTIMTYLTTLAYAYPEKVELTTIGLSVEQRQIPAIKITSDRHNIKNNPIILISSGWHSHSRTSYVNTLYLIQQLVQYKENEFMLCGVDWIIVPVINPDGYVYSMEKDRHWWKNRARYGNCTGVDLHNNFDVNWKNKDTCIKTGAGPFSEPESRAFRDLVMKYKNRIEIYISVESGDPMIMYPWFYTTEQLPAESLNEHTRLGNLVAEAIRAHSGTKYRVEQASHGHRRIDNGRAFDWIKKEINVPFSITILSSTADGDRSPPTSTILPIVKEVFEGFKTIYKHINKNNSSCLCNKRLDVIDILQIKTCKNIFRIDCNSIYV